MAINRMVCRYFPKEKVPPCDYCMHYMDGVNGVNPADGKPLPTKMCADRLAVLATMDVTKTNLSKIGTIDKFNNTVDTYTKEARRFKEGLDRIPLKQVK